MKQFLRITAAFTCALLCYSVHFGQQLQFNQVITLKGFAPGTVILDTVPAGKTWKIENAATIDVQIKIKIPGAGQDQPISASNNLRPAVYPGIQATFETLTRPIWLQEGDVLTASGVNSLDTYFISIIEFNIVP